MIFPGSVSNAYEYFVSRDNRDVCMGFAGQDATVGDWATLAACRGDGQLFFREVSSTASTTTATTTLAETTAMPTWTETSTMPAWTEAPTTTWTEAPMPTWTEAPMPAWTEAP